MGEGDMDRDSRDRARRERPSRFSETSRDRSSDRGGRDRNSMKSSNNRVYVSNIPYEYRWQDMKDLFRKEVGDVQFVELFLDDNDKPKGCGIVEFSDSSLVKKCLEVMQRYEVKSRKLVIREDSGNMRDKHGNIVGGGGGGNKRSRDDRDRHNRDDRDRHRDGGNNAIMRQDDSAKWGNTYGLSPHFLESLNIDPPLSNKVFVANLEYNIDKKKLKEVFRLAGRVIRVDINLDKDGHSRGFAVVEYDHPVEAVQAISMLHNQVLFDRTMTVRMDRANEIHKLPEGLKSIGMGLGPNGEPLRNVSHNLPNSSSQAQNVSVGAGLLGAVPNNALQVAASALSGLNNVTGLANLNPSVLQAANLSGFATNLLQNGLGGGQDLSSLVQPGSLMQNQSTQQQLAALAASNVSSGNMQNLNLGHSGGGYPFKQDNMSGRGNDNFNTNQPVTYPPTQSYSSRNTGTGNYQDNTRSGNFTNPSPLLKPSGGGGGESRSGGSSRKVLISNLPPTANYQLLQEKLNEFGEVSYWEEKGIGSFLVVYSNEWQAERAIRNLDKARIDGRLVDARTYY